MIPRETKLGELHDFQVWALADDHTRFVKFIDGNSPPVEFDLNLFLELLDKHGLIGRDVKQLRQAIRWIGEHSGAKYVLRSVADAALNGGDIDAAIKEGEVSVARDLAPPGPPHGYL